MSLIADVANRKERAAYVRFEVRPMEDKQASKEAGRCVMKDVEFALITAPYSRDVLPMEVPEWLSMLKSQVDMQQIPQQWQEEYRKSYEFWKQGLEMPLSGTPIKGWGMISPATQEELIRMNIRTVEDLAVANDEAIRRIGMGAVDLRNKANGWLAAQNDSGKLAMDIAAAKQENDLLKGSVSALEKQVEELKRLVKLQSQMSEPKPESFLEDDEPTPTVRRGKK